MNNKNYYLGDRPLAYSINDVELGAKITIYFTYGEKEYEFESSVVHLEKGLVCIDVIRNDGKVLGLGSVNGKIMLVLSRKDEKPIVWTDCTLKTGIMKSGTNVYIVSTPTDGRELNRRSAFRLYIGLSGTVSLIGTNTGSGCIVKDFSTSGFAFLVDRPMMDCSGRPLLLKFDDPNLNMQISCTGSIVREATLPNGKYLYGARLTNNQVMISKYLNLKQHEELQRRAKKEFG